MPAFTADVARLHSLKRLVRAHLQNLTKRILKKDIDNQDAVNDTVDMNTEEQPMPRCFAREMNDNYTILDSSGFAIGMEHNKSEADKYVSWYRNRHGMKVTVRENSKDDVRRALKVCPNVARHPNRDDIIYGS